LPALSVYLDERETHTHRADKVIHHCLLADRFGIAELPVKGSFENGWPTHIHPETSARPLAHVRLSLNLTEPTAGSSVREEPVPPPAPSC
jgi:hypothetical protein